MIIISMLCGLILDNKLHDAALQVLCSHLSYRSVENTERLDLS